MCCHVCVVCVSCVSGVCCRGVSGRPLSSPNHHSSSVPHKCYLKLAGWLHVCRPQQIAARRHQPHHATPPYDTTLYVVCPCQLCCRSVAACKTELLAWPRLQLFAYTPHTTHRVLHVFVACVCMYATTTAPPSVACLQLCLRLPEASAFRPLEMASCAFPVSSPACVAPVPINQSALPALLCAARVCLSLFAHSICVMPAMRPRRQPASSSLLTSMPTHCMLALHAPCQINILPPHTCTASPPPLSLPYTPSFHDASRLQECCDSCVCVCVSHTHTLPVAFWPCNTCYRQAKDVPLGCHSGAGEQYAYVCLCVCVSLVCVPPCTCGCLLLPFTSATSACQSLGVLSPCVCLPGLFCSTGYFLVGDGTVCCSCTPAIPYTKVLTRTFGARVLFWVVGMACVCCSAQGMGYLCVSPLNAPAVQTACGCFMVCLGLASGPASTQHGVRPVVSPGIACHRVGLHCMFAFKRCTWQQPCMHGNHQHQPPACRLFVSVCRCFVVQHTARLPVPGPGLFLGVFVGLPKRHSFSYQAEATEGRVFLATMASCIMVCMDQAS